MTGQDPAVVEWMRAVAAYRHQLPPRPPRRHWWRELVTDAWRTADHAWQLQAEAYAVGYATELAEFAAMTPRPRLGEFMVHMSCGPRP